MRLPYPSYTEPFSAAHALALGHTLAELRQAQRAGRLIRLRRGVYIVAEARRAATHNDPVLHAQDIAALSLAMPRRRLVAVDTSAARIHGLAVRDSYPNDLAVAVEGRQGTHGTHRDGYFLRVARLPDHHLETKHGVLVTTPARTVLDVAAHHGLDNGVVAADAGYKGKLFTPTLLRATVDELERRPGIEVIRDCVEFADPACESVLESISRLSMREIGIPMPATQVTLYDDGYITIRVDFYWEPLLLVGEADGESKYTMDGRDPMASLRAQQERERILRELGFDIVRWNWHVANNPRLLGARLRSAFARAEERRGHVG
ncbi:MAG TPA: hypothetical protein VGJ14_09105 [Sporichthyaceae bacterium]|jgi:hypothetical protein